MVYHVIIKIHAIREQIPSVWLPFLCSDHCNTLSAEPDNKESKRLGLPLEKLGGMLYSSDCNK